MRFEIKQVILWPKDRNLARREVHFATGMVNVITGASQTGKSAIVPILDYCLGSGRCAIPVNIIRNNTAWFGVLLETPRGELLLARREPGELQSTGDMYIAEGKTVEIPQTIDGKNTNADFVKSYLDEISGLSSLDFDAEGSGTFRSRPSFRDLAAFNFQPQNIIANPDVLFFKADTVEHREKLRTIFPYVLGVVTADVLAKRYRLEELKREERRLSRELDGLKSASDRWLADLQLNIARARELGLVSAETRSTMPQAEAIRLLRSVAAGNGQELATSSASINSTLEELTELRDQEQELSLELTRLRQRWIEMSRLRRAAVEYREALQVEEERLGISRWLLDESHDKSDCPVCGSDMAHTKAHLEQLVQSLEQIEGTRNSFRTLPETFDREYARVRSRITKQSAELATIQHRIQGLQTKSEEGRRARYTEVSATKFTGRLEADLALFDRMNQDEELLKKREALAQEIRDLTAEVDERTLKERERRALALLTALTAKLLPQLGVERPDDPVSLSLVELTLRIKNLNREDSLWEIGSGSNWLAYHLANILALHEYFLDQPASPVPTFLVLDQPSQVYFPTKLAARPTELDADPKLNDDDALRVRAIFQLLARVCDDTKHSLQIIVLDHAGESVWGEIPTVNLVEEWRDGTKLIPANWIVAPNQ
jgi:hypothetical protein